MSLLIVQNWTLTAEEDRVPDELHSEFSQALRGTGRV